MIDPAKSSAMDQQAKAIAEMWATVNWAMYVSHIAKGFSERRAANFAMLNFETQLCNAAEREITPPQEDEEE